MKCQNGIVKKTLLVSEKWLHSPKRDVGARLVVRHPAANAKEEGI